MSINVTLVAKKSCKIACEQCHDRFLCWTQNEEVVLEPLLLSTTNNVMDDNKSFEVVVKYTDFLLFTKLLGSVLKFDYRGICIEGIITNVHARESNIAIDGGIEKWIN